VKPEILMLAGAGLLVYWFFSRDTAPPPPPASTPGANTTGGGATAPGSGTGTAPGGGVQPPPQPTTPALTKAQKLAQAAGGNSQSFDVWNYYYKQLFDPTNAQPEPESYMGSNARDAKVSAEQYLQLRGLSGVGNIYRRRYIN